MNGIKWLLENADPSLEYQVALDLQHKTENQCTLLQKYSVPLFVQTRYTEQGERIWQSSNDGRRSASLR